MRPLRWIALLALLGLGSVALDGRSGVRAWWTLRGDLAEADRRIAALEGEVVALRTEAEGLADDPHAIERAIREDLELARPGESVVRVPEVGSSHLTP